MPRFFIGTSGWSYSHWDGIFYPKGLSSKEKLEHFSKYFSTAEINYSFYHLPRPTTYQNWYKFTPKDFVFSVKASRFITHIKRLRGIEEALDQFIQNALNLKEKLGPILFQFPPSFHLTKENEERLERFLKLIFKYQEKNNKYNINYVLEFRHKSWCSEQVYKLLRKYKAVWVIADSSRYPKAEAITGKFVYIRMHGPGALFSSKYSEEELKVLSQKIKKWLKKFSVYCYFNNDFHGYAIENAQRLISLLK